MNWLFINRLQLCPMYIRNLFPASSAADKKNSCDKLHSTSGIVPHGTKWTCSSILPFLPLMYPRLSATHMASSLVEWKCKVILPGKKPVPYWDFRIPGPLKYNYSSIYIGWKNINFTKGWCFIILNTIQLRYRPIETWQVMKFMNSTVICYIATALKYTTWCEVWNFVRN